MAPPRRAIVLSVALALASFKPDKDDSYLDLWLGLYSISTEPDDERIVESIDFSQENLVTSKSVVGMDTRGTRA
jgi:hypothetical protein